MHENKIKSVGIAGRKKWYLLTKQKILNKLGTGEIILN